MELKALKEKHARLNQEIEQMAENAEMEKRELSDSDFSKIKELEKEIENLEKNIEFFEKRQKKEGEQRNMEMSYTNVLTQEAKEKELEVRGLNDYLRKKDTEEMRAINVSGHTGNLTPTQLSKEIIKKLEEYAPLFGMIPKIQVTSGNLEILRETSIGNGAFVGDLYNLGKEDFTMDKVKLEQRRCGSAIELSQMMINDAGIDLVGYATDILYRRLGYALDRSIVSGLVAQNQFEGLVNAPAICNFATKAKDVISIDDFMNLSVEMHPQLQPGAVWIMNLATFKKLSLLKDNEGHPYLIKEKNVVTNRQEHMLLGYEILINNEVGDSTEGLTTLAYLVNFDRAYKGMIKKDVGFRNISDDTTNALRGQVTLLIDIFADVRIVDPQAIKVLKNKAV